MLTDDAYNRYKLLLKTYPNIEQHVSQYHIASYLGIRAESLSRIKSLNIGK
jgi:CRP-like cAMP-binding protein